MLALARDGLTVKIALRPLRISVRRGERRLMRDGVVRLLEGSVHDHFVQVTEGVLAREEIDDRLEPQSVEVAHGDAHSVTLTARFRDERVARIEISLPGRDRVRVVVLGAEGWELATVLLDVNLHREKDGHVILFKRRVD